MNEDDDLAAVQFLENRVEERIAEILAAAAREDLDSVGLERVQPVRNLLQTSLDIGKRQGSKEAEALWMIGDEPRKVLIRYARKPSRLRGIPEPDAGRREREHPQLGTGAIHLLEHPRNRPVLQRCDHRGKRTLRHPGDPVR